MRSEEQIMKRLKEHKEQIEDLGFEVVGTFLYGSQNYKMETESSDIDSKVIVVPSFEDFLEEKKPCSFTHKFGNGEQVDCKDIRTMFANIKKQNVNFVEILFTKYFILNPKYEELFLPVLRRREFIGRYNPTAALNCVLGMAYQKEKALCHPYPATKEKIEKWGFDPKQLHHILRLQYFMEKYCDGSPYDSCLIPSSRTKLMKYKENKDNLTASEATEIATKALENMKKMKDEFLSSDQFKQYIDVYEHNKNVTDKLLKDVSSNIIKKRFIEELLNK